MALKIFIRLIILNVAFTQASSLYDVTIITADKRWSGTGSKVYITLYGKNGESGNLLIPSTSSNFRVGSVDQFKLDASKDIGEITKIRIGHDNSGGYGKAWLLTKVLVKQEQSTKVSIFPVNRWLQNSPPHKTTYVIVQARADDCGMAPSTSRVVNGENAKPNQWPWQAQIKLRYRDSHHCGGTLIHPLYVLTAAHCLSESTPHSYTITLGEHDLTRAEGTEQVFDVKEVLKHQQYRESTADNDIALMKLSRPALLNSAVKLACLPESGYILPTGQNCVISGWGKRFQGGKAENVLQQARLPVVGNSDCHTAMRDISGITKNMICAGGNSKSGCHGDSGGPFVCQNKKGKFVVQGAVSWGSPYCSVKNRYSVFARVSLYVDWIESKIYSWYV